MLMRKDTNTRYVSTAFIGDSFIQGLANQSIDKTSINLGIGTVTIAELTARISQYQSITMAKCIVIQIGFNDIKLENTIDELISSYKKLLDNLPKTKTIVINN